MNSALKVYNKRKVDYKKIDLFKYEQENLKPSSVFILIFETNMEKEVLFLKRSNSLQYHKGEICFPGGSYEHEDQYLLNTAFREVEEETGINKNDIDLKFSLNEEITRTRFAIKPFVGVIKKELEIKIDNNEIEYYFKLPLNFIEDKKNMRSHYFLSKKNKLVSRPAFFYEGNLIWGATANILKKLLAKI